MLFVHFLLIIEPGVPGGLFVNVINASSINVTWYRPNVTNGIIIAYEIVYSNSTSPGEASLMTNMITNTYHSYVIDGLEPLTEYNVAVRAYTRIGAGNLTCNFSIWTNNFGESIVTTSNSLIVSVRVYKALQVVYIYIYISQRLTIMILLYSTSGMYALAALKLVNLL